MQSKLNALALNVAVWFPLKPRSWQTISLIAAELVLMGILKDLKAAKNLVVVVVEI
jgi:hypothetical protein